MHTNVYLHRYTWKVKEREVAKLLQTMNLKWIPILVHCGDWSDDPCWELKRNHTLNLTQPPRMSFRRPLFWRRAAGHQPLSIRTGFFWVGKITLSIIGAFERLYFSCKFFCANPMYYSIFTYIYLHLYGKYRWIYNIPFPWILWDCFSWIWLWKFGEISQLWGRKVGRDDSCVTWNVFYYHPDPWGKWWRTWLILLQMSWNQDLGTIWIYLIYSGTYIYIYIIL